MTDSIVSSDRIGAKFFVAPRRNAFATALITLIVFTGIWWASNLWYRTALLTKARGDVLAELDPYGNALTIDLGRRFDLIYGLGAWISTNSSVAELGAKFESFARQLREGVAGIRNLNVAPDGVVRFVYPRADNDAIVGRDLINDSRVEVRQEVARALKSRRMVISGPLELVVGGVGAVARLAIHRGDSFWGLINVAIDIPPILAEAGITSHKKLQFALRDARGRVFFGAPALFDANSVIHRIDLPDGYWELAAIPVMGWDAAIRRDLRIFNVGALTIVLLLSAIAYLLAFRAARLNARVQEHTRVLNAELSHRNTIEIQLRAAEERYRSLVEVNPDAVLVAFKKKIVYANKAALKLFGANSLHDLLGRSPFDLVHPDERAEVENRHQRALETGAANQPSVQRRVRLDGSPIYVETIGGSLAWEGGTAVQVIMRDITEQRRAERSLHSLIEATQDAVISIDRQARIVMFNAAAQRVFGYSRAEVAGKKINMLMAEPYAHEHDGYIARYENTGEPHAIGRIRTVSARRKNGETFPIELSVTQVATGEEVNYAAFIRDISEKVNLQQQAVENERLATIGTMAAKFGHELGNPLNGMSLTIQLLEQRLKRLLPTADEQMNSTVTRLKSEISRLNILLQDFRSLSRKERYNFQSTSLSGLVGEAIEIELPHYVEQGIEVESSFTADLPPITVDIDKMKQVILNLAKNAVDAMPKGGKLSFACAATAGGVTLEISDTGVGIPPEVDIFEPFFTTKSFGTGIGMTIVRQILAAHGATIGYRSEPGKGTTFSIRFPLR